MTLHTYEIVILSVLITLKATGQSLSSPGPNEPDRQARAAITPNKDQVAAAMDRLHSGAFSAGDVDVVTKTVKTQAIPELKVQFDITKDQTLKSSIASALVRLADPNPAWWDYLVQGAADAITTDAPPLARFDNLGKLIPGPSTQFADWARANKFDKDSAVQAAMFELPAKIAFLGKTKDRRAVPLLQQALTSSNFMIQAAAAQALAELSDKASIPLIIQVCQQAPADAALVIAGSLLRFDDEEARDAAKLFRPATARK